MQLGEVGGGPLRPRRGGGIVRRGGTAGGHHHLGAVQGGVALRTAAWRAAAAPSTHSLSLTDEGERLLEGARDLLREAERLEAALDHTTTNGAGGRIRLGAPAPLIRACLARHVPMLLRASPGIDLDLKVDDGTLDLAAGSIDVAIRFGALTGQPGLVATPLGSFPRVLVATPRYVEVMGIPQTPTDLERHHQIGYRDRASGQLVVWQFVDPEGGAPSRLMPRHRLVVEDVGAAWQMMRQGLGIAWLPAWAGLADLRDGRAVELLPDRRIAEVGSRPSGSPDTRRRAACGLFWMGSSRPPNIGESDVGHLSPIHHPLLETWATPTNGRGRQFASCTCLAGPFGPRWRTMPYVGFPFRCYSDP